MCYEVKCPNCGKGSWEGCGRHVPAVYKRIPEGQHCQCKAWPGVNPRGDTSAAAAAAADPKVAVDEGKVETAKDLA